MTSAAVIDVDQESESLTDLQRLQGTWSCVSGWRPAELVVSDYLFAVRFQSGDTYLGLFRLGPDAQPRTMDMRIDEGPPRHRGKIARCIYELDGDILRWCPALPGDEQRPTRFAAADDRRHLCLTFRREEA
jgi:uncharacterized protein (TIGR03067 family)